MNSVLNPEAPEFHPHLTSVTQEGYTTVHKTIRSSNQLPLGPSYDIFKTFTDFNVVTCQLSENVVVQSSQILKTELATVKLKLHDHEHNLEQVVDANDNMLDRLSVSIERAAGGGGGGAGAGAAGPGGRGGAQPAPVIAKIQVGSTTFIGAKNIPRPQLMFKDQIDNSDSLWVPRIVDKPNSIKPLALKILYNNEGVASGYEHPYKTELEQYQPPPELLVECRSPPPPPPLDSTPLTLVETAEQVDALVEHLDSQQEIAVDLEHHSYRTYQGITCVIQISTETGGDFIVDALAAREHLHKLNRIFTDPTKIKIFHGADSDVLWLQRDFGVYVVGMFDTHRAAQALQLPALSLKRLLMHYCGIDIDKKFQLADWRIRPLPAELVAYARCDTHYLLYVWRRMRQELLDRGQGDPYMLRMVLDSSALVCLETYNKEVVRADSHLQLLARTRKNFNTQQMAALKLLYKWRDSNARELDESTTYLLPNHMLLSLAETLPREVQGVNALCSPMPPFVKQNLIAIHNMLLSCRELPLEAPLAAHAPQPLAPRAPRLALHTYLHDYSHLADLGGGGEVPAPAARAAALAAGGAACAPDIALFATAPAAPAPSLGVVSDLNVDAKLFIPPYERYKKYRTLAQIEEIKEFKEKEAKIAAINKGNELIKTEVLFELKRSRAAQGDAPAAPAAPSAPSAPAKPAAPAEPAAPAAPAPPEDDKKTQRKRKISDKERKEPRGPARAEPARAARPAEPARPKLLIYKNANYRKFYDDAEKARKQPKMKFKKHK